MAMEFKSIDVKNSEETKTIEFWQHFGWELKSSQRVYSENKEVLGANGYVFSLDGKKVDFTKLLFQRDKDHPNYEKIADLEKQYFRMKNSLPQLDTKKAIAYNSMEAWAKDKKPDCRPKQLKMVLDVVTIILVVVLLLLESFNFAWSMIIQGICLVSAIVLLVLRSSQKKKCYAKALSDKNSPEYERLREAYEAYERSNSKSYQNLKEYNEKKQQMEQIITELDGLI